MTSIRVLAPTTAFGIGLLKNEIKTHTGENVLISPISVSIALAMTMNGARGDTQKEILQGLSLPDYGGLETTNLSYANLLADLADNAALGVDLQIANAIWANQNVTFSPEFLETNRKSFNAQVASADFAAPATLDAINQWASDNTKTLIPTILDKISSDHIMFLLNAVYFKGQWSVKFDKLLTREADFHATAGDVKCQLMQRRGDMAHLSGTNFQAVKLPFGDSKRINLYVYLPNAGVSVDDFVQRLTEKTITNLAKTKWESEGTIFLPRFKVDYDVELNDTLKNLGMNTAFEPNADFSGMGGGRIKISEVKHKTFAKFDEDGGEAAAITSVGFVAMGAKPMPWTMRCDRPFVAALYDEHTGSLLFIGVVNAPD
ncbi:MAG: serpin family protein [Candidatus Obscuribacterales bacterium]|nr:serpin family protein [Candidatus Obscuribacterales bacterium]